MLISLGDGVGGREVSLEVLVIGLGGEILGDVLLVDVEVAALDAGLALGGLPLGLSFLPFLTILSILSILAILPLLGVVPLGLRSLVALAPVLSDGSLFPAFLKALLYGRTPRLGDRFLVRRVVSALAAWPLLLGLEIPCGVIARRLWFYLLLRQRSVPDVLDYDLQDQLKILLEDRSGLVVFG